MRKTSVVVYNQIESGGLLSKMRWRVYAKLYDMGPATAAELANTFGPSRGGRGEAGNVHARLNELLERGVAEVVRERTCSVTGRVVNEYDVTDQLPKQVDRAPKPVLTSRMRKQFREAAAFLEVTGDAAQATAIRDAIVALDKFQRLRESVMSARQKGLRLPTSFGSSATRATSNVWVHYSLDDFNWGELDEKLIEIASLYNGTQSGSGTGFGETSWRDNGFVFDLRTEAESFAAAVKDNWPKIGIDVFESDLLLRQEE